MASDPSLTQVWIGIEAPAPEDMLPKVQQTMLAFAYESGVQVRIVPWVYGVDAPPFSQQLNARSYEIAASQHEYLSASAIEGLPVLIESDGKRAGPSSIEFNLGTENADALTIAVIGNYESTELLPVAASIISQWAADHPPRA